MSSAPTISPSLDTESPVISESGQATASTARLVSLDAYRGFVMFLMASGGLGIKNFVDQNKPGGMWPLLKRQTDHVDWRGCTLWDLIQPSFMFMVGVALPFSLASRRERGHVFGRLFAHALLRSLIAEADASGRMLSIHVEAKNPARRLYERLGAGYAGEPASTC